MVTNNVRTRESKNRVDICRGVSVAATRSVLVRLDLGDVAGGGVGRPGVEGELDDGEAADEVRRARRLLARDDRGVHGAVEAVGHVRLAVRDLRVLHGQAVEPREVVLRGGRLERERDGDGPVVRGVSGVDRQLGVRLEGEVRVGVGALIDVGSC